MKRPVLLLIITVLVAAAASVWWLGGPERVQQLALSLRQGLPGAAAPPQARPNLPVPVEAAPVQTATVTDEVEALGTLAANETVGIAPEIAGRLTSLGFKEGDRVRKGQTLAELDTAVLAQEVKQAEVDSGLARDAFQRSSALVQRGSGTRVSLEQAEAQLAATEARLAMAKSRLDKATILAPTNGVVGLRSVSVGSYLTPGQTIVTLTDLNPIKVDFRVPELLLQKVGVGQKIRVRVDALGDQTFEGEVYAIDPVVDVNGRAIRLRARIPNPEFVLKPGLFARVNIVTETRTSAVVVPESAIVPDGEAKAVYLLEGDKAKLTRVGLGKRLAGRVEVTQGLRSGQQIVTSGQMRLRDGAAVEVIRSQARAGTGLTQ